MLINHGAFESYVPPAFLVPDMPPRPVEPPPPPSPPANDASDEDMAAHDAKVAAYQAALTKHRAANDVFAVALEQWVAVRDRAQRFEAWRAAGALFARRVSDKMDWYELAPTLPIGGHYAVVSGGVVTSVSDDPTRLFPTAGAALIQTDADAAIGMVYDSNTFVARVTVEQVVAERQRRLAAGFDYDFTDARGVHRIGTTSADMIGWDEVTKSTQALLALGRGATAMTIVTDTGPAQITGLEWQSILIAATLFRQPIWAASFVLQAMSPIPADFRDNRHWA